jgi:hypothetical protein
MCSADLTEIAHVEPLPARRAFHVVVGVVLAMPLTS